MIKAGEIYFVNKGVRIGEVNYARPCLILRTSTHDATICFFSTKMDLRGHDEVGIQSTDAEFPATGLRHSSFILNKPTPDVNIDYFSGARLLGCATESFKKRVEEWYGAQLG
jgi:hypothetical protein